MTERDALPAGIDVSFFDAEIDRALAPYRRLLSEDELGFMREQLVDAIVRGSLRDHARRAAPRIIEESIEAPLKPAEAELVRSHRARGTGSGG